MSSFVFSSLAAVNAPLLIATPLTWTLSTLSPQTAQLCRTGLGPLQRQLEPCPEAAPLPEGSLGGIRPLPEPAWLQEQPPAPPSSPLLWAAAGASFTDTLNSAPRTSSSKAWAAETLRKLTHKEQSAAGKKQLSYFPDEHETIFGFPQKRAVCLQARGTRLQGLVCSCSKRENKPDLSVLE